MSISQTKNFPITNKGDPNPIGSATLGYQLFFAVTLDGRKVKALESEETLFLPTEGMAYAVAKEWMDQKDNINKLLMPMVCLWHGCTIIYINTSTQMNTYVHYMYVCIYIKYI